MEAVNVFSAENREGRINLGRAAGSTETAMFLYDATRARARRRITTSTSRSGCWSSTARSSCAHPRASRRSSGQTSSAFRPAPPVPTR
jgi:hypothetical protein